MARSGVDGQEYIGHEIYQEDHSIDKIAPPPDKGEHHGKDRDRQEDYR